MTIAVIIPNYNNERFIERCLNSVLNQTRLPDEVIVVDDSSTDASAELIRKYEREYSIVHGIYLTQNGGVSHARNVGIEAATSEYISTLDADDYYFNADKLKNELAVLEKHPYALSYSKLVYVDETDAVLRYIDYPKRDYLQGFVYHKVLSRTHEKAVIRDYCFPRGAVKDVGGYDESSSLFEDLDFFIRLTKTLPVYCTFEYGTAYRIKGFGLSQKPQHVIRSTKQTVIKKYIKDLPLLAQIKVRVINRCMTWKMGIKEILKKITRKKQK